MADAVPVPESGTATPPIVPGYRLERLLGRGGSGEVWRAVPRGGGPAVAVKVLVAGDPERQAREAALLAELDHPHLVRLHEVVHQPRRGGAPRVALVLDLLAGGSLAALLARRGRLRPGEVVTAVAPIAAAVARAHEDGVIHGDLSPGNIVFTAEGRPVLTDLGVARVLGEEASGEVTPAYVDPTVARGGAPGPASDVFGVAAAAFHALTGIPPWNAAGPAETLRVAATGFLPDLAELAPEAPAELVAVIHRGLAADPADRGSAAEFALDLRHACRPEPLRLPTAGVADVELGRTGRGPRTELTHQVPGRHRSRPAEPSAPRREPRFRRPRLRVPAARPGRRTAVLLLVAVVGGAVWLGTRSAAGEPGTVTAHRTAPAPTAPAAPLASPPPTTGPAPAGVPGPADRQDAPASAEGWRALVGQLYGRRAGAFAAASADQLDGVYTPGSPLRSADAAAIAELVATGRQLRGFAPAVARVTAVAATADRAELELVDAWPAYEVVAAVQPDGPSLADGAARGAAPVRMLVVRTAEGWRIESATRPG